jgi:hypothetical protein
LALDGDTWRHTVVLEVRLPVTENLPGPERSGTVTLLSETPSEQRWEVQSEAPGWLVVRDLYWPGWKATVEGASAEVLPADGLFRAVAVRAGSHEVRFRYRPLSFTLGFCFSSVSLLGIGAGALWRRRKGRAATGNAKGWKAMGEKE